MNSQLLSNADGMPQTRAQLRQLVKNIVKEEFVRDKMSFDETLGFAEQGVDSIMAVRLYAELKIALDLDLPKTLLFDAPSFEELNTYLGVEMFGEELKDDDAKPAVAHDQPIAIVGASCRFPGADNLDAFWQILTDGTDVVSDVPADRWDAKKWYDSDPETPGRTYSTRGGFLDDIQSFDAAFFRISPREAQSLDPQQRLLLEVGWEALEHAGHAPDRLKNSNTGVFVGATAVEYLERNDASTASSDYTASGNAMSMLSGRLSYFLGLHGPSLTIDTACSSSLSALHLACQSLRQGECDQALVGGVNLLLSPKSFVAMARLKALSPDGRCKSFSDAADGYGRAEGCGVVVLKPLSAAELDGDRIMAVIRGTTVNHDGPSSGLTVPSGKAQQALLKSALVRSGLTPDEVDVIECHGTGTPLGDPIEVNAINAVYGDTRSNEQPLILTSAKANIGHTEAAAGMAGLLKVILALRHGEIPAQPSFGELNASIPWSDLPVVVPQVAQSWPKQTRVRRAGVSSFGMSGTNAHVIVEEATDEEASEQLGQEDRSSELCILSAATPAALDAAVAQLLETISAPKAPSLRNLGQSLATTRTHLAHRLAVTASSLDDMARALNISAQGELPEAVVRARTSPDTQAGVVFVFPGQGSQWIGMGLQLLREEAVFRDVFKEYDALVQLEASWSPLEVISADEHGELLSDIAIVQPVLFVVQVALAALWRSWGIEPSAVVGHSMGEIAAACVAGVLSGEDAVKVIVRRSRLMKRISCQGEMALVRLTPEKTEVALKKYNGKLSIAVSNSPFATVVAGEPNALNALLAELEAQDVFNVHINVDVASHSAQVDPLLDDLKSALSDITSNPAQIPMWSTVTNGWKQGPELDFNYWANNLRQPVRFLDAVQNLLGEGFGYFIDVGPHPLLTQAIEEICEVAERSATVVGSLQRARPERQAMLEALGALYTHGASVDWSRVFPGHEPRVSMPNYPWQRQRYWIDATGMPEPIASTQPQSHKDDTGPALKELSAPERPAAVSSFVKTKVAHLLGFPVEQVDPLVSLLAMGMDSLSATKLRNIIQANGFTVGLREILSGASVESLSRLILDQLGDAPADRPMLHPGSASVSKLHSDEDPWFVVPHPKPGADFKLLCFPYAGGGPGVFAPWAKHLPDTIECAVIQLAGRGSRLKDAPCTSMDELVTAMLPELQRVMDRPTAFIGHSLGAQIMFEAAQRLQMQHETGPVQLFVSGSRAPHFYTPEQHNHDVQQFSPVCDVQSHALPDKPLLDMFHELGMRKDDLLATDQELRDLVLRTLRADLEINNTYLHSNTAPLDIPITAVGARSDPYVNGAQIRGWRDHTTGPFSAVFRSGGHFFIEKERDFWIDLIKRDLLEFASSKHKTEMSRT